MDLKSKCLVAYLVSAGLVACVPARAANNLVTNGGFETGDYSGWQLSGDESAGDGTPLGFHNGVGSSGQSIDGETPIDANSGSHYFYFGNANSDATLSQDITTSAGQKYDFSFYVNVASGAVPNDLNVNFGNNSVYNVKNLTTTGWTKYDYVVSANGPLTTVSFSALNYPTNVFLDDVSVKAVPEASTVVTFGLVLAAGTLMLIRRRPTE